MKQKYYAVKKGKKPGIYRSWAECSLQVQGFSGAVYKSFSTEAEAKQFINSVNETEKGKKVNPTDIVTEKKEERTDFADLKEGEAVAYVDGSFEKSFNKYSYGCVILYQGTQVELSGFGEEKNQLSMHNVAGEILGSMQAIRWAIEHGVKRIFIYHDYEGIARWADGDWKANKEGTKAYQKFIKESREKIEIRFIKVAAHTGVEFNERADQLAKAALGIKETGKKE